MSDVKTSKQEVEHTPESQIYTLSLGDSCDVVFSDKCSANTTTVKVADNTVYSMSTKYHPQYHLIYLFTT